MVNGCRLPLLGLPIRPTRVCQQPATVPYWALHVNYYKRHLGDYAKHTSHLTVVEHGLYNLFLDWYYVNEKPIPPDLIGRLARGYEVEARAVLMEFFTLSDDGWRSSRADEEIREYHKKAKQNQEVGKLGGRPRKTVTVQSGNPDETQTVSKNNPDVTQAISHKPLAIKEQKSKSTVRQAARFAEFWAVYPNKKGKQEAEKRWQRDGLDGMADDIIAHVHLMTARDDGWQRGYAPMGSTYLNQARWTDEPTGPALNRSAPGKQMTGLMALEEMKHGVVPERNHHGHSEAGLFGLGTSAGWGSPAGHGGGLAGSPRLALGSGNGHAPDTRGVLDLGPNGYRVADAAEAD